MKNIQNHIWNKIRDGAEASIDAIIWKNIYHSTWDKIWYNIDYKFWVNVMITIKRRINDNISHTLPIAHQTKEHIIQQIKDQL